jgi:imidazolonepropionase-like amidohydrolase
MRTTAVIAFLLAPLAAQSPGGGADDVLLLRCGKVIPVTSDPIDEGDVLIRNGKIEAVGRNLELPKGARLIDQRPNWVFPGFVDLHHHIEAGGGDINDMVHPLNPELRTYDLVRPDAEYFKESLSGGVTSALFIPGSGTNLGGFGALCKMAGPNEKAVLIRPLGGMKIAQAFNPERPSGDLGASRMGMSFNMYRLFAQAKRYTEDWAAFQKGTTQAKPVFRPELEQLRALFEGKCPVLIHTAGARDVVSTARMFHDVFKLWMILSHGCFDAHLAAPALAERNVPVNLGPRNYQFTKDGIFVGVPATYFAAGCKNLSLNTDAPVVPPEELFVQGAMAVRLGLPWVEGIKALTIHPARQVGIGDRVGSIEPGKDADLVVKGGDPLDPSTPVELVFIDGRVVYRKGDLQ